MQSVLNVRMDSALKERGDKVLAEHGISVSNAVRALWVQLAETRTVPEFIEASSEEARVKQRRLDALKRLAALGRQSKAHPAGLDVLDGKALKDAVYEERLEKYMALE